MSTMNITTFDILRGSHQAESSLSTLPQDMIWHILFFHYSEMSVSTCIENGWVRLLEFKLKKGEINLRDRSMFEEAAFENQFKVIKWLMENGAEYSPIAMDFAVQNGNMEIIEYLTSKNKTCSSAAIIYAIIRNNVEIVKFLLANHKSAFFLSSSQFALITAEKNKNPAICALIKENM